MNAETRPKRLYLLTAMAHFAGASIFAIAFLGILGGRAHVSSLYALVLIFLNAALAILPFWLQARQGVFDLWHPMAYASFMAIIPMVVVKGLWVVLGSRYSGGLTLTPDPDRYFNLALFYSLLGYSFLMAGFYSSIGRRIGFRLPHLTNLIGAMTVFSHQQ